MYRMNDSHSISATGQILSRGLVATIAVLGLVVSGCETRGVSQSEPKVQIDDPTAAKPFASAELAPKSGSAVRGQVQFRKISGGLVIDAKLSGVTPAGRHGFHIHETGDCSAPDASSAGGHFNPTKKAHGAPNSRAGHVGDLGNVDINANGEGTFHLVLQNAYYDVEQIGNWDALIGKAVVLHSGTDDLRSQPSGDAGNRIGCGVIVRSTAQSE